MFESRIIMQKVLAGMNQLPQSSTYKYFIKENDDNFNKNIVSTRSSAKKLLGSLLDLQVSRMILLHLVFCVHPRIKDYSL